MKVTEFINLGCWLFLFSIILITIAFAGFVFYQNHYHSHDYMWSSLDRYNDDLISCSLQVVSLVANGRDDSAQSQLIICKSTVNEALVKINGWGREDISDEVKASKIDYELSSSYFDAVKLMVDVRECPKEIPTKQNQIIDLLNNSMSSYDRLVSLYSDTKYYKRYYGSKSYKYAQDLRNLSQLPLDYHEIHC